MFYVIDAGVAVKWFIPEVDSDIAHQLLERYLQGVDGPVAPDLLIAEGLADSIMTAHVFNRRLDRRYPATLSRATITGLLRETLGFGGPVVSDDLRMGAIDQHYGLGDAAVLAARAGVDVLLVAEDALPDGRSATAVVIEALREALADGRVTIARIDEALARMRQFSVTRGAAARPPLGSAANPGRRAGYS